MMRRRTLRVRRKRSGFTLIELVVVIALVSVLIGVLLDRVQYYQEMAEKVAMEQTVSAIRGSLHLQVANLIVKDRADMLPALAEQNPMDWLAEKPANYAGMIISVRKDSVVSGQWYFNESDKTLIYLVHNGRHFQAGNVQPKRVVFRTKLLFGNNVPRRGERQSNEPFIEGVILEQVSTHKWF
jgi:general secretion pathway protein G